MVEYEKFKDKLGGEGCGSFFDESDKSEDEDEEDREEKMDTVWSMLFIDHCLNHYIVK